MVWLATIVGIVVIWFLWNRRQDELYPPEMRVEKYLQKQMEKEEKVAMKRVKRAMRNPKYYEEMKKFDPSFTVPSGDWKDTPEGKEEISQAQTRLLLWYFFGFLIIHLLVKSTAG